MGMTDGLSLYVTSQVTSGKQLGSKKSKCTKLQPLQALQPSTGPGTRADSDNRQSTPQLNGWGVGHGPCGGSCKLWRPRRLSPQSAISDNVAKQIPLPSLNNKQRAVRLTGNTSCALKKTILCRFSQLRSPVDRLHVGRS